MESEKMLEDSSLDQKEKFAQIRQKHEDKEKMLGDEIEQKDEKIMDLTLKLKDFQNLEKKNGAKVAQLTQDLADSGKNLQDLQEQLDESANQVFALQTEIKLKEAGLKNLQSENDEVLQDKEEAFAKAQKQS